METVWQFVVISGGLRKTHSTEVRTGGINVSCDSLTSSNVAYPGYPSDVAYKSKYPHSPSTNHKIVIVNTRNWSIPWFRVAFENDKSGQIVAKPWPISDMIRLEYQNSGANCHPPVPVPRDLGYNVLHWTLVAYCRRPALGHFTDIRTNTIQHCIKTC